MKLTCPSILDRHGRPVCVGIEKLNALLGYIGPGFFVTVGFIDPGNWAANIAAGSQFGYKLLWVVTLSTAILILWQHMSAHLGIVTGKCLAEAVREYVSPVPTIIYGVTAMAACVATALAEILGAAIGINILFHLPLKLALIISSVFVLGMIWVQKYNALEKLIVGFVSIIGFCYLLELYLVKPDWPATAVSLIKPSLDSGSVLIAMSILGAVVMPHNMYLHSEVIQNRDWNTETEEDTRRLLRYEFVDTVVAMIIGLMINAAMVIVAAAVFFRHGIVVTELAQASETMKPFAGGLASVLFGVALLFAGISSSTTAGVAGGTTFSGYLGKETRLDSSWFRWGVLITIIPALVIALVVKDTFQALIVSQVCLSVQLPLTMLPLYLLTGSRRVMGAFSNGWFESTLMIITGAIILILNALLLYQVFGGKF